MDDTELLRRYLNDRSESAFAELVGKYIDLVYSAALRQAEGDAHLAEDITQSVFTDLARKAPKLTRHTALVGWLYTSTRYLAANARRTEYRRRLREQQAHAMNDLLQSTEPEPDWNQIRPALDDAMHALSEQDREAVLMRYFERRPLAEVGRHLGLSENAARMRVDRALDKLRVALARRGVTSTTAALALTVTNRAVGAAPSSLKGKVCSEALEASPVSSGIIAILGTLMLTTKLKLIVGAAIVGIAALVWTQRTPTETEPPLVANQPNQLAAASNLADASDSNPASGASSQSEAAAVATAATSDRTLRLKIVTADNGLPVPGVPIDLRSWVGVKSVGKKLVSNRDGVCVVTFAPETTTFELTTRVDGFADTRLRWLPERGDVIPAEYTLRLDRSVAIGGRVVDADGNPVSGAKVGWNSQENLNIQSNVETHDFAWIETTTDDAGRWRVNRIAEDMIARIYGSARHSNHIGGPLLFTRGDLDMQRILKAETHLFTLGRALQLQGIVINDEGSPVSDAGITLGYVGSSEKRTTRAEADGRFAIGGAKPGKNLLTAEADGYAPTTIEIDAQQNTGPHQLILRPGAALRFRVVDTKGSPVPDAKIWLNVFPGGPIEPGVSKAPPIQVQPKLVTDSEGRASWENAPQTDAAFEFDIYARGYMRVSDLKIRPSSDEQIIALPPALTIFGTVQDATTGHPIPRFRIITGYPQKNPFKGQDEPQWSTLDRFWLSFFKGEFRHSFEEAVIVGMPNPGYIFKVEADGYAPHVTRAIRPDEGEVRLEVALSPIQSATITVLKPNGQPAGRAQVALVTPGSKFTLVPNGFSEGSGAGGFILEADVEGKVNLGLDSSVIRVMAVHPEGFAETTVTDLSATPILQLRNWARITGTCMTGGKPASGREYTLAFTSIINDPVQVDFIKFKATVDDEGYFEIPQVPPGNRYLMRIHRSTASGGINSWQHGEKVPVEIQPGETKNLVLNNSGTTVTARLRWPAESGEKNKLRVHANIRAQMPAPPPNLATNPEALQQYQSSPEVQAHLKAARHFPVTVVEDTLTAEEVSPGKYVLFVNGLPSFQPGSSGPFVNVSGSISFEIEENTPQSSIDLGEIVLTTKPLQFTPSTKAP